MSFIFQPAVSLAGERYELPRPVTKLVIEDVWDVQRFKVPLKAGDQLAGHSQNGVEITLTGQFGTRAGELTASEEEMFAALEELRTALHVGDELQKYSLYIYYDELTETYRRFQHCSTIRFAYDLSDVHLFGYSLVIHAEDPVLYATADEA
ncbi:MAG: hypothetical protein O2955_04770 [Planctomycetota bacterium]|nr:hypothetical protein [Planctomycetota bacterium]MDA1211804.1 hypothetical protein [Planctomycetota bacterium]